MSGFDTSPGLRGVINGYRPATTNEQQEDFLDLDIYGGDAFDDFDNTIYGGDAFDNFEDAIFGGNA